MNPQYFTDLKVKIKMKKIKTKKSVKISVILYTWKIFEFHPSSYFLC